MKESPHRLYKRGTGITLHCSNTVSAFAPDGSEIASRYWGQNRRNLSQHRLLVRELAYARRDNREVTRKDLLEVLCTKIETTKTSLRDPAELNERLSTLLFQLKCSFTPYQLFEKTKVGYRLHSSVKIEFIPPKAMLEFFRNSFENRCEILF